MGSCKEHVERQKGRLKSALLIPSKPVKKLHRNADNNT